MTHQCTHTPNDEHPFLRNGFNVVVGHSCVLGGWCQDHEFNPRCGRKISVMCNILKLLISLIL